MVSNILRTLRVLSGKTQARVAQDLALDYKRYNHYETGKREPDNETLTRIADYFSVTTDYLLGRDDTKKESATVSDDELSEDEKAILALYRQVSPGDKALVLGMIETALKNRGEQS